MHSPWINWLTEHLIVLGSHLTLFLALISVLFILQRLVFGLSEKILGGKIIYLSAWLGTPIHELSHAFFCLIFGHKIKQIVLFNPDKRGTLGYVTHSYNNHNVWQVMGNFFIGIAPLFGGLLGLYLATLGLLDNSTRLFHLLTFTALQDVTNIKIGSLLGLCQEIIHFIKSAYLESPLKVIIWAYLCASISLHLCPSKDDIKGAWIGFILFIALCLILMSVNQLLTLTWFSGFKNLINMTSMLYVIGIILGSVLVFILFVCRFILMIFSH